MKYTWTEHPMMNFPETSHDYVSLEVLKKVLTEDEFKNLKWKIRHYGSR